MCGDCRELSNGRALGRGARAADATQPTSSKAMLELLLCCDETHPPASTLQWTAPWKHYMAFVERLIYLQLRTRRTLCDCY
jgi:hypothetical protein